MKKLMIAMVLMVAFVANADPKTYYVNNDPTVGSEDYDGEAATWDGTHGPKLKIQSAIGLANAGDTVIVAPGTYGDDQGYVDAKTAGHACRVFVNKAITLKASGGRKVTHVVGHKLSDAYDSTACGEGAIGGILIASTVAKGTDTAVEVNGFTVRDCAADSTDASSKTGIGIAWMGKTAPLLKNSNGETVGPWVVDCTVSNSVAYGDVIPSLSQVNAVRCLSRYNASPRYGLGASNCNLIYCIIDRVFGNATLVGSANQYAVGCTIADGSNNPCSSSCLMNFCNSLITARSGGATVYCTTANYCVFPVAKLTKGTATNSKLNTSYNRHQLAAPIFEDYRPVVKVDGISNYAVAYNSGNSAAIPDCVPEKYRYVDFNGDAFTPGEDGVMAVGAVQTTMTPVSGFRFNDQNTTCPMLNGMKGVGGSPSLALFAFLDEESYPKQFEFAFDSTVTNDFAMFSITNTGSAQFPLFPTMDGKALFVPKKGSLATISTYPADVIKYVNDETGSDTEYDGTQAEVSGSKGPFKTIQKALDSINTAKYGLIYVAPGLYDEGTSEWSGAASPKLRVNISSRSIRIVGTAGAERTIIKGGADTTTTTEGMVDALGNGPEAVRCVRCHNGARACLQGFTITDGHTDSVAHDGLSSWKSGGAFICDSGENCWLMDCIVSNNFAAESGAVMYGGKAARCRIVNNRSANGPWFFTNSGHSILVKLMGCIIAVDDSSMMDYSLISSETRLINCTLYSSDASKCRLVNDNNSSYTFNCIFCNSLDFGSTTRGGRMKRNLMDNVTYNAASLKDIAWMNGCSHFVNAENLDFRLASSSDALGTGTTWSAIYENYPDNDLYYDEYYSLLQYDFDGNTLVYNDGKCTVGAYQKPAKYVVATEASIENAVTLNMGMTNLVDFGSAVTFTATPGEKRRAVGLEVNGEYMEGDSYSFTAPSAGSVGSTCIRAIVNTNWYADAINGNDGNKGWSEAAAVKTLAAAMDLAEAGDTVVALPGEYKEKTMLQSVNIVSASTPVSLPARVVVPENVNLVSRDGAEVTIIKGEFGSSARKNLGTGAVRCLCASTNCLVKGFTLTGGGTEDTTKSTATDNNCGAGVLALAPPKLNVAKMWITDCIISNNYSRAGGAGATQGCGILRCRFFDNHAANGSAAFSDVPYVYESIVDYCYGEKGAANSYYTRGCTFGEHMYNTTGKSTIPSLSVDPSSASWHVYNCLFVGDGYASIRYAHNCIQPSEGFIRTSKEPYTHENIITSAVAIDENYMPALDSDAANAADMDYVKSRELEGDVYGNQRQYNGGMDVGAVEGDWRPRYAADLGNAKKLKVTAADWNVLETADGVKIPAGGKLEADWTMFTNSRGTPTISFTVSEGATFTLARDGAEPVTYAAGTHTYSLADATGTEKFTFVSADGDTYLKAMALNSPFVITIR